MPTSSQWDPAFSCSHALWHCPRGPGPLVPQYRNPSLVTSSATAFGIRPSLLDEACCRRSAQADRLQIARARRSGATVCKVLHNQALVATVCKLLQPGGSAAPVNRTVRLQDWRLYRDELLLSAAWHSLVPLGFSALALCRLAPCPPQTCERLFRALCL